MGLDAIGSRPQHFEGHLTMEGCVVGKEHNTHTPTAEWPVDLIATERGARPEVFGVHNVVRLPRKNTPIWRRVAHTLTNVTSCAGGRGRGPDFARSALGCANALGHRRVSD